MKRFFVVLVLLLLIGAGYGAWALFRPIEPVEARIDITQCRKLTLTDAETGEEISGIEDIARLPGGILILSAHDRLDPEEPDGGVYQLPYEGVSETEVALSSIIDPADTGGSLRPHGIALSPRSDRLGLINRGRGGVFSVDIFKKQAEGWVPFDRRVEERYCRANDLDFSRTMKDRVIVSIDRQSCGLSFHDMLGFFPTGAIEMFEPGVPSDEPFLMRGQYYPNGITDTWIAETRADRMSNPIMRRGSLIGPINLPGGPDNITRLDPRTALVALHPSLIQLAAYRFGWTDKAPSRIAQVGLQDGSVEVLFDDPEGAVFSGATVAMRSDARLVMGSVREPGLMVCEGL
ncbi:MAG: hypothetical protein AAGC79_11470 [Pseudomonadota bacterium]